MRHISIRFLYDYIYSSHMASLSSPEEWRNALITLSQFVLLGEKEYVRKEIYKNVLEICIYLNEPMEPISFDNLQGTLRNDLWGVALPLPTIEEICRDLFKEGRVSLKDGRVFLYGERRKFIQENVEKAEHEKRDIEKIFIDVLVEQYRILANLPLAGKIQVLCTSLFWQYISKLVGFKASIFSQVISSSDLTVVSAETSLSNALFSELNKDIPDALLGKSFKLSFEAMFERRIGKFLSFLFNCSQVLTCWKVLSIDSSADVFRKEEFRNKRVILDTNCLLGLVCVNSYNHKSTKELVALTQQLETKVCVTSKTLTEFKKVLDRSNERRPLLNVPTRILKRINDDFISSYAFERDADATLDWSKYYERMVNVKDLLAKDFKIDVVDIEDTPLLDDNSYAKVIGAVSKAWADIRLGRKEYDVAEHDAFHLILVKKLREEDKKKCILGPNYWFLTRDSTLYSVNRLINSLRIFKSQMPSSIKESHWLDFIILFLSSKARDKDAYVVFADLLKSEFTGMPTGISPKVLAEIQGEWTKYEWLSTDDIEEILKNNVIQRLATKLSTADTEKDENKAIIQELRQHFDTLLSRKFNEKMDILQNEVRDANQKLDAIGGTLKEREQQVTVLENKVNSLVSEKTKEDNFKMIWRTIAGCLGSLLIIASMATYLTNNQPTLNTTLVSCLAIVVGAIFLLMAIAYEQVKARLSVHIKQ